MLPFIAIGGAIIGCLGFVVQYFALNELIALGMVISKQDFYLKLVVIYGVLLIPPFIILSPSRTENAQMLAQVMGLTIFKIAKWISVGALMAIGFNAFN